MLVLQLFTPSTFPQNLRRQIYISNDNTRRRSSYTWRFMRATQPRAVLDNLLCYINQTQMNTCYMEFMLGDTTTFVYLMFESHGMHERLRRQVFVEMSVDIWCCLTEITINFFVKMSLSSWHDKNRAFRTNKMKKIVDFSRVDCKKGKFSWFFGVLG